MAVGAGVLRASERPHPVDPGCGLGPSTLEGTPTLPTELHACNSGAGAGDGVLGAADPDVLAVEVAVVVLVEIGEGAEGVVGEVDGGAVDGDPDAVADALDGVDEVGGLLGVGEDDD